MTSDTSISTVQNFLVAKGWTATDTGAKIAGAYTTTSVVLTHPALGEEWDPSSVDVRIEVESGANTILKTVGFTPLNRAIVGKSFRTVSTSVPALEDGEINATRLELLENDVRHFAHDVTAHWIAAFMSTRDRCLSPTHLLDTFQLIACLVEDGHRDVADEVYASYVAYAARHLLAPDSAELKEASGIAQRHDFSPLETSHFAEPGERVFAQEVHTYLTYEPGADATSSAQFAFSIPASEPLERAHLATFVEKGQALVNATTQTPILGGDEIPEFFMETPVERLPWASFTVARDALERHGRRAAIINGKDLEAFLILLNGDMDSATSDLTFDYSTSSKDYFALLHDWETGTLTETIGDVHDMEKIIRNYLSAGPGRADQK